MKPIKLVDIDRLAQEKFGKDAAKILAGQMSIGLAFLNMSPAPRREMMTIVVPKHREFDGAVGVIPLPSQTPDLIRRHYASLEAVRPDLFN